MATEWQWDELIQRGTDYASLAEVEAYDARMGAIRDVGAEARRIIDLLGLTPEDVLLEIGTGTGAFARAAAPYCRTVVAIDISQAMLSHAARRATQERVDNVLFVRAGFLTYRHTGDPLSAVVTQLALHHLPDAWKLVALRRLADMLRPGGRLYLTDVVYPDEAQDDWSGYMEATLAGMPEDIRDEMAVHVRDEFSTFDWMMRGILERAGFVLERAEMERGFLAHYLCRKG